MGLAWMVLTFWSLLCYKHVHVPEATVQLYLAQIQSNTSLGKQQHRSHSRQWTMHNGVCLESRRTPHPAPCLWRVGVRLELSRTAVCDEPKVPFRPIPIPSPHIAGTGAASHPLVSTHGLFMRRAGSAIPEFGGLSRVSKHRIDASIRWRSREQHERRTARDEA